MEDSETVRPRYSKNLNSICKDSSVCWEEQRVYWKRKVSSKDALEIILMFFLMTFILTKLPICKRFVIFSFVVSTKVETNQVYMCDS